MFVVALKKASSEENWHPATESVKSATLSLESADDVYALKRQGRTLYGFGC